MKIRIIEEISESKINPQMAREREMSLDSALVRQGNQYSCSFTLPEAFDLPRLTISFGAVDQISDIYVNNKHIGHHEGGYLCFFYDITEAVDWQGENSLRVEFKDELDHAYPYGKQHREPRGMWYTRVDGIWKNVWLTNLPEEYVTELIIKSDLEKAYFEARTNKGKHYEKELLVEEPEVWTVENPKLYPVRIEVGEDIIESYFALRTVSIENIDGVNRVCLNHKPIFMHGVLDQGYWLEGLLTPPNNQAYETDIINMKSLGFNLLRKHVKVEAPYFYYACDKLGMLVCQDMVQNGEYSWLFDTAFPNAGFKRRRDDRIGFFYKKIYKTDKEKEERRRQIFLEHSIGTIREVYNHPSVIMYTIFNEGWGQFESDRVYELLKREDPDRLFDSTSGWFAQKKSDFDSEHIYFRNKRLHPGKRPLFLKECGGYVYPVEGHLWNTEGKYGYGDCRSSEELTERIEKLYEIMVIPAIEEGLCGCVYTQVSDIENEINGLYTYDREVCKVDKTRMQAIAAKINDEIMKTLGGR